MSDVDDIKKYLDSIGSGHIPVQKGAVLTESVLERDEGVLYDDDEIDQLEMVKEQMEELAYEVFESLDGITKERAKAYWFPQILQALGVESEFLGGSQHSMQDSIDELREQRGSEDDDGLEYETDSDVGNFERGRRMRT